MFLFYYIIIISRAPLKTPNCQGKWAPWINVTIILFIVIDGIFNYAQANFNSQSIFFFIYLFIDMYVKIFYIYNIYRC